VRQEEILLEASPGGMGQIGFLSEGGVDGWISSMALIGTDLYVAGSFTSAGGMPATNLARWDGNSWSEVGGGVTGLVKKLATDGTNLYVFGYFSQASVAATGLARWDGQSWLAIAVPFEVFPAAIGVRGSELFSFGAVFEADTGLVIARWTGSNWVWFAAGTFVRSDVNDATASGYDMAISGNDFFIAGDFDGGIAKWDGSSWSSLGSGVTIFNDIAVPRLRSNGSELFAAGDFPSAGGKPSANMALWHIPHALSISRFEDSVTLSWPSTGTNFLLESVETIGQTNWAAVPQPVSILNDQCVVTNAISPSNRFYRLRRK
jgi:hypothetical protein